MKIKRPLLLAGIGYGIIIAVTISLQIWALNKALILSDDGWFACLLRDHPKDISTQYHLLFGGVLRENLLASRAFAYVLKILSIFVLSLGAVYFKASLQKNNAMNFKYIFWAFSFLFVGQMDLGQTSLNYASLTLFIIELSLV